MGKGGGELGRGRGGRGRRLRPWRRCWVCERFLSGAVPRVLHAVCLSRLNVAGTLVGALVGGASRRPRRWRGSRSRDSYRRDHPEPASGPGQAGGRVGPSPRSSPRTRCPQPRSPAAGGGRSRATAASSRTSSTAPSSASCSVSPVTGWVPRGERRTGLPTQLGAGALALRPHLSKGGPWSLGSPCPRTGELALCPTPVIWRLGFGVQTAGLGRAEPWQMESQVDLQPSPAPGVHHSGDIPGPVTAHSWQGGPGQTPLGHLPERASQAGRLWGQLCGPGLACLYCGVYPTVGPPPRLLQEIPPLTWSSWSWQPDGLTDL